MKFCPVCAEAHCGLGVFFLTDRECKKGPSIECGWSQVTVVIRGCTLFFFLFYFKAEVMNSGSVFEISLFVIADRWLRP